MPRGQSEPVVRRGQCRECGNNSQRVQEGWVSMRVTAERRDMCRRCWRMLMQVERIVTPQMAGRLRARWLAEMTDEDRAYAVEQERTRRRRRGGVGPCRHGIYQPQQYCRVCRARRREIEARERNYRQRAEEERLYREAQYVTPRYTNVRPDTTATTSSWTEIASGLATGSWRIEQRAPTPAPSAWWEPLDSPPYDAMPEVNEEPETEEVLARDHEIDMNGNVVNEPAEEDEVAF